VLCGLIGEAKHWQISGYMPRPNKEKGPVLPEDSNGPVTELTDSTTRGHTSVTVVGVCNCISLYVVRITVILKFMKYCN
jgi:hypothetical protein